MRKLLICFFFLFSYISFPKISLSQEYESAKDRNKNRPVLFNKFLDTTEVNPNFFNQISSVQLNDKVTIQISQQFILKGVVNILHETIDYRAVSIESEEIPGLRLILSHTSENKYYGIVGCVKHKDVLTLRLNEITNKYVWVKKEFADIIPD